MAAGLVSAVAQTTVPPVPVAQDPPQVSSPATVSSTTTDQAAAADMVRNDAKGRHLAPRGTFYLLSYVAVKTDKGVDGFDPGQEVSFVEAHRDARTLVVTDGHAQVEVPASKLTNDMDIAAMVRRNDQAGQAQIAAYTQAEEAAYLKAEKDAADATARDLEHRQEEQSAQEANAAQAQAQSEAAPQAAAPASNNGYDNDYNGGGGYYGNGGYGYGSPYSYFIVNRQTRAGSSQTANGGPGTAAAAPSQSKSAAPAVGGSGGHAAGGRPK